MAQLFSLGGSHIYTKYDATNNVPSFRPDWRIDCHGICSDDDSAPHISGGVYFRRHEQTERQRPPDYRADAVALGIYSFSAWIGRRCILLALPLFKIYSKGHMTPPNKSPEPTAVGAVSSAVAVRVAGRRWLSFFR